MDSFTNILESVFDAVIVHCNYLDAGIWSYDTTDRCILLLSRSVSSICGISQELLQEKPELWYEVVHPDDMEEVMTRQALLRSGSVFNSTYRIIDYCTGQLKYIHDLTVPIMDAEGRHIRSDGMVFDISEKMEYDRKIRYLVYHDELTNLPNRRAFREYLAAVLDMTSTMGNKVFLAYLDLNKFKMINDSLGHASGDAFLIAVSQRLQTFRFDAYDWAVGYT